MNYLKLNDDLHVKLLLDYGQLLEHGYLKYGLIIILLYDPFLHDL